MVERAAFLTIEGRPAIRFGRPIDASAHDLWSAITDPRRLGEWFPSQVEYQPRVGGAIHFRADPNAPEFDGTVLAWDPETLFEFVWGRTPLRLEVHAARDRSLLVLVNTLEHENEAARNAAGWEVCLAKLEALLGAAPRDVSWDAEFDAYVASGMPAGAPVPGR